MPALRRLLIESDSKRGYVETIAFMWYFPHSCNRRTYLILKKISYFAAQEILIFQFLMADEVH